MSGAATARLPPGCELVAVTGAALIAETAAVADAIWREHYPPMIGTEQVDYMLARFQTPEAIALQIDDGHRYRLLRRGGAAVGYLAWRIDDAGLFVSKIYVVSELRGSGLGRACFEWLCAVGRRHGCRRIWLTVNRGNRVALEAYRRWGMRNAGAVVADIGGGFVMDDYRFELDLGC